MRRDLFQGPTEAEPVHFGRIDLDGLDARKSTGSSMVAGALSK
ncbi:MULTISPECIES: hypothetical protein [Pseudofrankia]|nr:MULTISPECIES: hypothetical protein [Pseudofrankia]